MGRDDLADPTHPWHDRTTRDAAGVEVNAIVERWLGTIESREVALQILEAHRVPAGPVLNMTEVAEHPAMAETGMVRQATDPVLGRVHVPGFPLHFSAAEAGFDAEAPFLAEHSAEVLAEIVDAEELEELIAMGVVPPTVDAHRSRQRERPQPPTD